MANSVSGVWYEEKKRLDGQVVMELAKRLDLFSKGEMLD
jgi:hypothetical protein